MKTKRAKDAYDYAVEYLTAHPDEIEEAWNRPGLACGGILFNYAGGFDHAGHLCGCLTQVKAGGREAQTPDLTRLIRNDKRIPSDQRAVTPADLPVFAEWQRRLDAELGRTPPVWGPDEEWGGE